jgi:hypothetical protein
VTEAEAVGSACETAVNVTEGGSGRALGAWYPAWYPPSSSMVPQAVPEQPDPSMRQITAGFLVPFTEAITTSEAPTGNTLSSGTMLMVMPDFDGD